ncbi:hypothetical protein [Streptomyces phaeoluteigriseus]|uniref:hypothetical protein n=1 Tax=Streptomyces phaeoluteigriseus TaxID=114686 RepID=UPI00117FB863|nr:hypothetical protein [Streptomyces phaeoluteigriseus]
MTEDSPVSRWITSAREKTREMNPVATPRNSTAAETVPRLAQVSQLAPAFIALLAMITICVLAATGHTEQITAVAWFGGTVFAGGTIISVTVHIRR